MAIQKFLQGGYVGKLGATIGQRWKNMRIVRSYVIPHNPKTEKQQANRGNFAEAVRVTHTAMAYNYGAPCWIREGNTEYAERVGQAKLAIDRGVAPALALPLFPTGYSLFMTVADCSISTGDGGMWEVRSGTISTLSVTRKLTVSIRVYDTIDQTELDMLYQVETTPGSDLIVRVPQSGRYIVQENALFVGASYDDADNEEKSILISQQTLTPPQSIELDDIVFKRQGTTAINLTSQKAAALQGVYNIAWQYEVFDARSGIKTMKTYTAQTQAGSDIVVTLPVEEYEVALSECTCQTTSITPVNTAVILTVPAYTVALGKKNISREYQDVVVQPTVGNRLDISAEVTLPFLLKDGLISGTIGVQGYFVSDGQLGAEDHTAQFVADSNTNALTVGCTLDDMILAPFANTFLMTDCQYENDYINMAIEVSGNVHDDTQIPIQSVICSVEETVFPMAVKITGTVSTSTTSTLTGTVTYHGINPWTGEEADLSLPAALSITPQAAVIEVQGNAKLPCETTPIYFVQQNPTTAPVVYVTLPNNYQWTGKNIAVESIVQGYIGNTSFTLTGNDNITNNDCWKFTLEVNATTENVTQNTAITGYAIILDSLQNVGTDYTVYYKGKQSVGAGKENVILTANLFPRYRQNQWEYQIGYGLTITCQLSTPYVTLTKSTYLKDGVEP